MHLVRVAVPIPKNDSYVYSLPDGEAPEAGLRVLVPLGRRRLWGTVLEAASEAPRGVAVRPISGIPEPRLTLPPDIVSLCRWIADYYAAGLGETLAAAAPAVTALQRRAPRAAADPDDPWHAAAPPPREALSGEQAEALAALESALDAGGFRAFLLYGITGSGKTAVYLHAALRALAAGGQALVLVPEIALAPQAADAFRQAGVARVALYHSELRPREARGRMAPRPGGRSGRGRGNAVRGLSAVSGLKLLVTRRGAGRRLQAGEAPRYHARDVAWCAPSAMGVPPCFLRDAQPRELCPGGARRLPLLRLTHRVDRRPSRACGWPICAGAGASARGTRRST